jgi:NAD(P)-dependent dehydrogenase (short-subunit alcohol dehydrogenase family)
VAIAFAKEGARMAIVYLNEHRDAKETDRKVREYGAECLLIAGDVGREKFCQRAVQEDEGVRFNNASVGREILMIELKTGNEFCAKLGEPAWYSLEFEEEGD